MLVVGHLMYIVEHCLWLSVVSSVGFLFAWTKTRRLTYWESLPRPGDRYTPATGSCSLFRATPQAFHNSDNKEWLGRSSWWVDYFVTRRQYSFHFSCLSGRLESSTRPIRYFETWTLALRCRIWFSCNLLLLRYVTLSVFVRTSTPKHNLS